MKLYNKAGQAANIEEVAAAYLKLCGIEKGVAIESPAASRDFLKANLAHRKQEVFGVLYLDNRHRVLEFREEFKGTIDATTVYPRELVRSAIDLNAAAIVLAHNHPSGVPEPSASDKSITRRIRDAMDLIDVRVLDHFIVTPDSTVSLAMRGEF